MEFLDPPKDLDLSFPIEPMRLRGAPHLAPALRTLIDELIATHPTKLTNKDRSILKDNYRQILLNVIINSADQAYTGISQRSSSFSPQDYWGRCGLTYRFSKAVINRLSSEDYITKCNGFYNSARGFGRLTRIYWTQKLFNRVKSNTASAFTTNPTFGDVEIDRLIEFKRSKLSATSLGVDHPDVEKITSINKFLGDYEWRFKGPIRLIYTDGPLEGGRLYTKVQNIPKELRYELLINGSPTVELDYKSNHLMMSLAILGWVSLPADPYQDLANKCGLRRDQIKSFITIGLGASNEVSSFNALKKHRFTKLLFNNTRNACHDLYPNLPLFTGTGVYLQSLEGQIALDILHEGSKVGIPVIPVHDSFITTKDNEAWLMHEMLRQWSAHLRTEAVTTVVSKT